MYLAEEEEPVKHLKYFYHTGETKRKKRRRWLIQNQLER